MSKYYGFIFFNKAGLFVPLLSRLSAPLWSPAFSLIHSPSPVNPRALTQQILRAESHLKGSRCHTATRRLLCFVPCKKKCHLLIVQHLLSFR